MIKSIKLSEDEVTNARRRASVRGYRKPSTAPNVPTQKLNDETMKRIGKSNINEKMYQTMLYFAKKQPHGYRKLNFNNEILRDLTVLQPMSSALTDRNGLSGGGQVAFKGNTKLLNQKQILFTIKNNNRVTYDKFPGINPNYTSFKNDFKLK